MYTRQRTNRSLRIIPAAEPKCSPNSGQSSRNKPGPGPTKKAKTSNAEEKEGALMFDGRSMYFLPVEMSSARRNLLSSKVGQFGGNVVDHIRDGHGKAADYIVVDDHVNLNSLCRALESGGGGVEAEKVIEFLQGTLVVRTKWLSECLRTRTLLPPEELNRYIVSHINGTIHPGIPEADTPSDTGAFPSSRDPSPDRENYYHSDDDHKSTVSDVSDIDWADLEHRISASQLDSTSVTPKLQGKTATAADSTSEAAKLQQSNFFLAAAAPGHKAENQLNEHIIKQLEEMMTTYRNMGEEFRMYAYARAVSAIRKYPKPIVSAQQLKEIKNIGPRIASHIMEIIETGEMEKNKELTHNDQGSIAMSLFVNIHGVGTKTAQRWVQMGLRTLDDVREKISLTAEQQIGLKYYEDFQEKMPRAQVKAIAEIVMEATNDIHPGFIFKVCGSYCRGREMCGDVDLLMTHPDGRSHDTIIKPLLARLHQTGFLTDDLMLADGHHKKYFGVCQLPGNNAKHRRLDIIIPPYQEWATCVLGWSGSMYFVRSVRHYASKKNMSLTDYSLNKNVVRANGEKVSGGEVIDTPTEESIFEALGLPYLPPTERDH